MCKQTAVSNLLLQLCGITYMFIHANFLLTRKNNNNKSIVFSTFYFTMLTVSILAIQPQNYGMALLLSSCLHDMLWSYRAVLVIVLY